MALPKLNTPTFELILPSDGSKVRFRPFLVKEHKVLLTMSEAENEEVARIIRELVDVCTFKQLKVDELPHFDIEYIFMFLRAKSIGESVDVIVSSSCFEHSEFFWLIFNESLRILKPTGLLYINVPSNGQVHRFPVDCWRFFPDSGLALQNWGKRSGYNCVLLESFIGIKITDIWNDFVGIFAKDENHSSQHTNRIHFNSSNFTDGYLK